MITKINTDSLYNLFRVVNFDLLEGAIDNMAPSLVEYYLSGFSMMITHILIKEI
jgi:hypothetical protein